MAVAAGPLDSFGKHPALGSRPAVTVDQPPLAVGVRFPLCPPRAVPSLLAFAAFEWVTR